MGKVIKIYENTKNDIDLANLAAQNELNDGISVFDIIEESFKRSILFKDINVGSFKNEVVNIIINQFFNEDQSLKSEYVKNFIEKYKFEDEEDNEGKII